eukprot:COSAG01_NODE_10505_length_2149_cov_5.546829_1_plen_119_part_00
MLLLLDTCVTLLSLAKTRRPVVPVVQIAKMLFVLLSVVAILVVLCTGARDIVDRQLSWPSDRGCCGACKDVTKPHFSGCAGHVETYLDFGGIMYRYSNVCESAFIPPQHRTFVWSEFH